jgi:predicted transcriptional regulator
MTENPDHLLSMTVAVVCAALPVSPVGVNIPELISTTYAALGAAGQPAAAEPSPEKMPHTAAVSVRKSLADPKVILSMIDGKPYKALRRHLSANGLTPAEYRERYNLPADYPMTAPVYSAARSEMAKASGLGKKRGDDAQA